MHVPLVYVVMLTYNRCEDTLRALGSLARMEYPNYRLLVVDNHSSDQTVEQVRSRFPLVEVIVNPANFGFAAGINVGIKRALNEGADLVLVINNDVIVAPSMLMRLVEAMAPDVGIAAPLIYYLDEPKRIWSSGFSRHPLLLEMRDGARGELDQGQWQDSFDVDYLLGCAMLLSREALETVGLFDERYFFYYEDLDLCLRMQRRGYRLITVPKAKMWHKGAASAGISSAFRAYHMARSSVIFFGTHAQGPQRPLCLLFRLGSALKKSFQFVKNDQASLLYPYWKGLMDGWRVYRNSIAQ